MSTSNDTVYVPANIEVLPCNDREVSSTNSIIDITPCEGTVIPVRKKEYGIVGDSFYTSINDGPVPPWLAAILDNTIDSILSGHLSGVTDANRNLLDAIFALDVAHNDYNEMVHIDVRVDQAISSHLTTLNSRLDSNDATIIQLNMNKVTPEMAAAISIDAISASLDNGAISGRMASIDSSISTLAGNVTSTIDLLESRYGELNEAIVEFTIETGAAIDKVYSSFKYNSILKVGDERFRSGFGLNSEVKIPVPGEPGVYHSEFWIDAQRLKFTNSNQTGSVSPFTIDASGTVPKVSFNGVVSFSNVTGPDKPEAGATKNEFRGAWTLGTAYRKGDVVTVDGNSWGAKLDHRATSGNRPPVLSTGSSSTWLLNAAKGDQGPQGVQGIQGVKGNTGSAGADGASSIVIYRNVTGKPAKPANSSSVPSGWLTFVNNSWTGNVWMCRGIKNVGSSVFTWGEVELDFSSWKVPNKTTIDGAYIETGSITAEQINTKNLHVASAADFTGDLQSTDFLTGVQGWRLRKTGDIELNGAQIRGLLDFGQITVKGRPASEVKDLPNMTLGVNIPAGKTNTSTSNKKSHTVTFFDITSTGRFDVRGFGTFTLNISGTLTSASSYTGEGIVTFYATTVTSNATVIIFAVLPSGERTEVYREVVSVKASKRGPNVSVYNESTTVHIQFSGLGHIGQMESAIVGYEASVETDRQYTYEEHAPVSDQTVKVSTTLDISAAKAYLNRF